MSSEAAVATDVLRVDLFADVVCPWCYVGTQRLERVLAESGRPAVVTYHPYMLDPRTPPEGDDVPARLRRKYGVEPERLWARVEAEAGKSGLTLDLSKQRFSYPTARALTLVRLAQPRGTQSALMRALYAAYFDDARNIHAEDVLADVATLHGFTADEVKRLVTDEGELTMTRSLAAQAAATGIQGVPFYVFDDQLAVAGAQPEEILRTAIARAATAS